MARVVILQGSESTADQGTLSSEPNVIAAGEGGLVQLRLEQPLAALPGDRFIIRSYSPQITIGGGVILDALPEKHRLRDARARARLIQLEQAGAAERLAVFVEMAGVRAITEPEIAARTGATDQQIAQMSRQMVGSGRAVEVGSSPLMLISTECYRRLADELTELLVAHHRLEPLSLGVSREEVRDRVFGKLRPEIFRAVIAGLVQEGRIAAVRDSLRLASHRPALTEEDGSSKQALEAAFKAAGLQAGTLEETASASKIKIELAKKLYNLLAAEHRIIRIGEFVFHVDSIDDLKARVRARKSVNPRIDVAVFKEITGGLSRKHAIPLLEYLDRERVTRRVGNEREIL
jgi:selenocysteine-specific elongation factor